MNGFEWTQIIFSGIVAISTICYVVLTRNLVNETRKTRNFHLMPNIGIHIEKSESDANNLYLIIENIGYGVANDVEFRIINEFSKYHTPNFSLKKKGVFNSIIESFYPSQKFKIFIDYFDESNKEIFSNEKIIIQVSYIDILNTKYFKTLNISANELLGNIRTNPPDTYIGRMSYYLKKINENLTILANK